MDTSGTLGVYLHALAEKRKSRLANQAPGVDTFQCSRSRNFAAEPHAWYLYY